MIGEYVPGPALRTQEPGGSLRVYGWGALLWGLLAVLATGTYLHVLGQPFLSDDYIQVDLGRKYGDISSWPALLADPLYRCRATSIVLTRWTEQISGIAPAGYYASAVLLHVLNTWMVFLNGVALGFAHRVSFLAAALFAIGMRHQEAVMWYAALPELLLFFFCGCFLWTWNRWTERGGVGYYALAVLSFVLAVGSKEPGVVLAPVAAAMAWRRGVTVFSAAPFAVLAAGYTALNVAAKANHLHWNDGTFSLSSPFLLTWARSLGRMFWVWGAVGVAAVALWARGEWKTLRWAALWTGLAMLPYSFLLYMPVVPSRHMYLAGAGAAFFAAAGLLAVQSRFARFRWVLPVLLGVCLLHNVGYVWTKKRRQFDERAAATEDLLRLVRKTDGLIYVTCFPYGPEVAEKAIAITLSRNASMLVWDTPPPPGAVTYCAKHP